jgi:hypothetical protein
MMMVMMVMMVVRHRLAYGANERIQLAAVVGAMQKGRSMAIEAAAAQNEADASSSAADQE